MNTTQLKRFAAEARNKLREGVKGRLIRLGFDLKTGEVPESLRPVAVENAGVWRGKAVSNNFMYNWNELYDHVKQIGIKQMIEEGAYTWFNRLVAIRILAKNNLCDAVLQYVDSARTPRIVDEARTKLTYSEYLIVDNEDGSQHSVLSINLFGQTYKLYDISYKLFEEDSLVTEQFAVLINAWVNNNPIISTCFDAGSKHFMELLLPDDIRNEGGFLDMLNSADFITDEDYHSPELIGWLYQFYISERKDEVFAKKGKYDADEIAPATQIFTPNWIVKYMVQNTVGRIYLDSLGGQASLPDIDKFKAKWKYLVEPSDSEKEAINYKLSTINYDSLESLKVADLACGSGHILNECFDLLYELYIHEGYSRREAITNIFEHNLTGIDIDLRAKQLATFALLLKACQRDSSFADAHCLPRVYDMPKVNRYTFRDTDGHFACAYQIHLDYPNKIHEELDAAFTLMENADSLGSIMKFDISPKTREYLVKAVECFKCEPQYVSSFQRLIDGYNMILALTEKYDAIVMNPPYMPTNKIDVLKRYAEANYREGKADLFAVFMQVCMDRLRKYGRMGMINMQSWMFLSSFESLRELFLKEYTLSSMLHLGPRTFDELSGEVVQNTAFVFEKVKPASTSSGIFYRLVEGKNCADKERIFITKEGYYPNIPQSNFIKMPIFILGYWVSTNTLNNFSQPSLRSIVPARQGLATGDNSKFIRFWFEPDYNKIGFDKKSIQQFHSSSHKYVPHNKGGEYRKWYGSLDTVLTFDPISYYTLSNQGNNLPSRQFYFREGLSFPRIGTGKFYTKYYPLGLTFDCAASSCFPNENEIYYICGLMCSSVMLHYLGIISPTISFQVGDVFRTPYVKCSNEMSAQISHIVCENIMLSKSDWDAHETSWDFQVNEIIRIVKEVGPAMAAWEDEPMRPLPMRIGTYVNRYKTLWESRFLRLHANEEELNRRFIEIYGLQDELTPDVPLNEVTILQQGEISIWKEGDPIPREVKNGTVEFSPIVWHDDVLMKQLISYAVGCMMGRYRLDRPGLAVAHPNPTPEELGDYNLYLIVNKGFADEATTKFINEHESEATLQPDGTYKLYDISYKLIDRFAIDDDAIIPLMPADCGFYDNATQRMSDFVCQVFGADTQTENLNYIEKCLGKSIEQYFIKDFWKDHKKMYQNRPIYWLFSSKKGAFQVITYMHRMTPYTVERIRAKYLLPYIETLTNRIAELQAREDELSTAERRLLDSLQKQLEECREYHDRLAVVAERAIGFDLDDGVIHNYALYGDILAKLK